MRGPRCRWCQRAIGDDLPVDVRLGHRGLCRECVEPIATECLRIHRRLPRPGEFCCRACKRIRRAVLLVRERDATKPGAMHLRTECRVCYEARKAVEYQRRKKAA